MTVNVGQSNVHRGARKSARIQKSSVLSRRVDRKGMRKAWVESRADVQFWRGVLRTLDINDIIVEPIRKHYESQASGKDAIKSVVKKEEVGEYSLYFVDSDYDFLLNVDYNINDGDDFDSFYCSPFVFQTYAYAIENYLYDPLGLVEVVKDAACTSSETVDSNLFIDALEKWSFEQYGNFLNLLYHIKNGDNYQRDLYKGRIQNSFLRLSLSGYDLGTISELNAPSEFVENLESKGLNNKNMYLYFCGHDIENVLLPFLKGKGKRNTDPSYIHGLYKMYQDEEVAGMQSLDTKPKEFAQMKGEYFGKCRDVETLLMANSCNSKAECYQFLINELIKFKKKYSSNEKPGGGVRVSV
ncbi:DUF4435 domain-containing protein [Vibrio tasmaniensis 1F-187]|uniref:DUF4435 domain-containing protein n=1 Tax=unclassified Vibrio TaxID=2614977 RepID=UPI000305F3DB|nr:DUF4435 domain-containing protein [Vibrio tasmaniensis]OEF72448.1 hypothetical protein A152_12150 [Vibrio tasmaniensis 1F-187]